MQTFEIVGEKKAAHRIIFLHGWGGSRESFRALAGQLKNTESILLDIPGFGSTPALDESGSSTYDYANWFFDLAQKNSWWEKKTVLYGHSFGCRFLARLLQMHPDFPGKIIFSNGGGVKLPPSIRVRFIKKCAKIFGSVFHVFPQKAQSFIRRKILRAHDWDEASETNKKTMKKVLVESDTRDDLAMIKNPVLIFWGKKDMITPIREGKIFAEKIPHAEFIVFEDGYHGIHHTHTKKIAKKINQWLEKMLDS